MTREYVTVTPESLFPDGSIWSRPVDLYVYTIDNNPDGAGLGTDAKYLDSVESYTQATAVQSHAEATAAALGGGKVGLCILKDRTE